jgi:predicted aconitase with swiveling domain
MSRTFTCHKIAEGQASGEVLLSADDMCFYLVDPADGKVIEPHHALFGRSIAGTILVFPNGKGSSVVQADGLYQLLKTGMAPKAMIVRHPDTTLVASAIIMELPLVDRVEEGFYEVAADGMAVTVDATAGTVTVAA